jgi:hypothetical protein
MTETKPQMEPNGPTASLDSSGSETSMPSELPPQTEDLTPSDDNSSSELVGIGDAAPSIPVTNGATRGITAWQKNKRINGLWTINQNRNSWIGVSGIGWRKLANNSDSGIVALTMLSAHAREKNSPVNYREESNGMIHEMYVW